MVGNAPDSLPPTAPQTAATIGDALWDKARLADYIGCDCRTVMRLVQRGQLPQPVIRTGRVVRWRPEDVRNHLARRAAMR